jgi:hypothetical protein
MACFAAGRRGVTQDPGEWADSMEISLSLEKDLGLLRR